VAVMMYNLVPLSLPNVEDLHRDRGIDVTRETAQYVPHSA
jgi:transposase-like protein